MMSLWEAIGKVIMSITMTTLAHFIKVGFLLLQAKLRETKTLLLEILYCSALQIFMLLIIIWLNRHVMKDTSTINLATII